MNGSASRPSSATMKPVRLGGQSQREQDQANPAHSQEEIHGVGVIHKRVPDCNVYFLLP
jgi:hypothetical protein